MIMNLLTMDALNHGISDVVENVLYLVILYDILKKLYNKKYRYYMYLSCIQLLKIINKYSNYY